MPVELVADLGGVAFPVVIDGETITSDMVRRIATDAELIDVQPGPMGLLRGEEPTHGPKMVRSGLLIHHLHLTDGRTVITYGSLPPASHGPRNG